MTNLADGDDFEAFAVDWISGNIYFATSVTQVLDVISDSTSDIFVTSKNTEYFRSIIHKNPGLIKGIVLAPMLGKMYWHDKGMQKYLIQIALDYDLQLQWNLDLRKPDLRKIVATTDFLVHKLFDLRKIF